MPMHLLTRRALAALGVVLSGLAGTPALALPAAAAQEAAAAAATSIPFYSTAPLTAEELAGLTLRELSLHRNTIFARAGNRFRRTWLREHFTAQPWYQPRETMDESVLTELDRKNAETVARVEAGLTEDELRRRAKELEERLVAGLEWDTAIEVETQLLAERLGDWPFEFESSGEPTPLQDPVQLDFLLTVDQLRDFSRRDLRILRNTIYARRGRVFQSAALGEYFTANSWYTPDPSFTEDRLTAVDRTNIRLVRSVEDEVGGPVSERDEDWLFQA